MTRGLSAELERLGGWPAPCEELERVGSTNDALRARAREGAPPWSVVTALEQTEGRGRHGSRWDSPRGHLYLSVLLPPPSDPSRATLLPLLGGLACAEALAESGVPVCLKWPNDVVDPLSERKLAGVLVEGAAVGGRLEHLVLGVGVNLVDDRSARPASLRDRVFPARDGRERAPERLELAGRLLYRVRQLHAEAEADGGRALRSRWRERSVAWWGREVEVLSGAERVRGIAVELSEQGALVLELSDGRRREVVSGEARKLRPSGAAHG